MLTEGPDAVSSPDNGSAYRSHAVRTCLAGHGIRHLRTRPYTPRTNWKAERLIQTLLREWAYERLAYGCGLPAAAHTDEAVDSWATWEATVQFVNVAVERIVGVE